jgi:hypothetical protein
LVSHRYFQPQQGFRLFCPFQIQYRAHRPSPGELQPQHTPLSKTSPIEMAMYLTAVGPVAS